MSLLILLLSSLLVCLLCLVASVVSNSNTHSPPTKSLGFRGFDSSRLLILRGGNYHVRRIL